MAAKSGGKPAFLTPEVIGVVFWITVRLSSLE